jgi:hypothetical protein
MNDFNEAHTKMSEAGNATGLTFILLTLFSGFTLPVLNGTVFCGVDVTVVA